MSYVDVAERVCVRFVQGVPGSRSWIAVERDDYRRHWVVVAFEAEDDGNWDGDGENQDCNRCDEDVFVSG